ncbi:hypothetical protein HNY73_019602 [Argiope bruennichi]|uniref:Uncharacterized protein n=1 Tax=Argiope bruennichi TaxID=94029 RepID=A0A8T0E5E0_ARGBR|nr:hypothetical protein HNY73_019602 [Argiope bruennichi]
MVCGQVWWRELSYNFLLMEGLYQKVRDPIPPTSRRVSGLHQVCNSFLADHLYQISVDYSNTTVILTYNLKKIIEHGEAYTLSFENSHRNDE